MSTFSIIACILPKPVLARAHALFLLAAGFAPNELIGRDSGVEYSVLQANLQDVHVDYIATRISIIRFMLWVI